MVLVNDHLKEKISSILNNDYPEDDLLLEALDSAYLHCDEEEKERFHVTTLFTLTHLEFSEEEAHTHWNKMIDQYHKLKKILGRPINFRMAVIDYFTHHHRILKNPMIIELKMYEVTEKQAAIDELTGLYNFRYFQKSMIAEMKRSARHGLVFSLVFMDLDYLKRINDSYGHSEGDRVLREVAMIIKKYKRTEDTVCRYGGDEFLFLLPQTECQGALMAINRIREKIEEDIHAGELSVTMSAGISCFPEDSEELEDLLDYADKALYKSKNSGKNCLNVWAEKCKEKSKANPS